MSAVKSSSLRPPSQPKDQLVLQVKNVALAGRLLMIEIFEVQNIAASTPSSSLRPASVPSTPLASSRTAGFRVAARDDVENEYSLFVTRQKAEYLYRAAYPTEAAASEVVSLEAMANGILAHLNIMGNRQRDVGKLICREPEPRIEKKTRVLPASTPPSKQRNPHLPSKRQDQRAVRVQKTSKRTMEAVAQAMKRPDPDFSGDEESAGSEVESGKMDRKSSEASILHRMAVADSKTMWKAELETNYEDSDHASLLVEDENPTIHKSQQYVLAPGLSPVKRALPERKTKHKDLEERRQKGRQQRILIAQAAQEVPPPLLLNSIQAQDFYTTVLEESDYDDVASRRSSMITISSTEKHTFQPRASSAPRTSVVVGNAYALKNLLDDTSEPEQFLRRRTLDVHRSVLRKDHWQDDIPGMGIEITDERPTLQTPPSRLDALLSTARRVMMVNAVGASLQRSSSTLRMGSEQSRTTTSPALSLYSTALGASHSAPALRSPKLEKSNILDTTNAEPIPQGKEPLASGEVSSSDPTKVIPELSVRYSLRPRSKSTSDETSSQSSLEAVQFNTNTMSSQSFGKQLDDMVPDQPTQQSAAEAKSFPAFSPRSISKEFHPEPPNVVRPRSNSMGYEGAERLLSLSSLTKPLVQDFLAPSEPETATVMSTLESKVVQVDDYSVSPPDPEVVLYPSNHDMTAVYEEVETNQIEERVTEVPQAIIPSFQEVMRDIVQEKQKEVRENSQVPILGTGATVNDELNEGHMHARRSTSSPLPQQEAMSSPTARHECWEELSVPVIMSAGTDSGCELSGDTPGGLMSSESGVVRDIQQDPVNETSTVVPLNETQSQISILSEGTNRDQEMKLREEVGLAASNNQSQVSEDLRQASKAHEDKLYAASNELLTSSENQDYHYDRMQMSPPVDTVLLPLSFKSIDGSAVDDISTIENIVVCTESANDGSGENSHDIDLASSMVLGTVDQLESMERSQMYPDPDKRDEATIMDQDNADAAVVPREASAFSDDISFDSTRSNINSGNGGSSVGANHQLKTLTQPGNNVLVDEENMVKRPGCNDHKDFKQRTQKKTRVESIEVTNDEETLLDQSLASEIIPSNALVDAKTAIAVTAPLVNTSETSFAERGKPVGIARKKSLSLSKKSIISAGHGKPSTKAMGSRRRSTVSQVPDPQEEVHVAPKLERRHTAEDVKKRENGRSMRRMSTIDKKDALPNLAPAAPAKEARLPAETSPPTLRTNSKRQVAPKRHSSQHSGVVQSVSNYHKKWGKWLAGRNIVEKVGCLQLEELVMVDPCNEENLLKLGLRYARWSGTSMPGIILLERAALLHKNATGTQDYWFWLGSAHLDIFMRHRKYLPVARFHLNKSLRAFTSAFAYIGSLADPMLLLRYAIGLFWHKGDGNLEKTRDIFHELFSQFTSFCDKDRPNLLFLQFQVLHRLKLYVDAIECMNKIITLHESLPHQAKPVEVPLLPSTNAMTHFAVYDAADYRLMLMQCQQASGDYVSAAQSLASVLKLKNAQQDTTLKDEEYFELWCSLAEKCFHHEDYALALEYYAIALNFAKQSQVLAAIHYNLGLCFQSLGEDNKCVTGYKRARTANRHVPPLVSLAELSIPYDERFAQLLQKPVAQTIEEVRVELYGRAVRRLQRVFRQSRRNLNIDISTNSSETPLTKMPSLSKRRLSIAAARNPPALVKIEDTSEETEANEDENIAQKATVAVDPQISKYEDSTLEIVERRRESFLARKQAAIEEMVDLLANPQYRGRETSPSSRLNNRSKAGTQVRSGLLTSEKDHLDVRRKHSMETFRQLGYVSSTMPWIEFWEKLLGLAPELFESRHTLYGSIARIRGRLPLVTDEVAFCALAESIGNVHEATEKLHDPSYERELTYVCAVIEVSKKLLLQFPQEPPQHALKPPHVSLPTISSPRADSHGLHSLVGGTSSGRTVLPPYSTTSASSSQTKKHLRMDQMLDLHFQEHVQKQEAAIAIAGATGGLQQRAEKLLVLQNFRQANDVLLKSQLAFGTEKTVI
ncbi:unnamed protein product [Phytophthora lilii]|uniref:Unnamed protein product n=1 Tax=Phytophthora lilii TaxID=2077276 RepID=A0A9W6UAG3_9STRA|nr:unnamed protein product [Phytophthora lilii]